MAKAKQQTKTMTEAIRKAIAESGLPTLTIAKETGVARASLVRFIQGQRSLRLDCADKLAIYFGLELRSTAKRK